MNWHNDIPPRIKWHDRELAHSENGASVPLSDIMGRIPANYSSKFQNKGQGGHQSLAFQIAVLYDYQENSFSLLPTSSHTGPHSIIQRLNDHRFLTDIDGRPTSVSIKLLVTGYGLQTTLCTNHGRT